MLPDRPRVACIELDRAVITAGNDRVNIFLRTVLDVYSSHPLVCYDKLRSSILW
jgi:hypothetical protein